MKAAALAFVMVLAVAPSLADGAAPLASVTRGLSAGQMGALMRGELLLGSPRNSAEARLPTTGSTGVKLAALADLPGPTVKVESASLARVSVGAGFSLSEIAERLLDVETLSGVTYYSERKKGIAVLFDDVYRVDAPGSLKKSAGPVAGPESSIHLKDSNFGSSWYSLKIETSDEGLSLSLANARPLNFAVLRAFGEQGVRMSVEIVPVREGVYIASMCVAEPSKAAASLVDMYSAMEKRLKAVQGWVVARIAQVRP